MVGLLLALSLSLFNSGANVAETSAWPAKAGPGPMHAWPGSVPWCVLAEHWRWFRARTYWPVGSAGESKCPFIHHACLCFLRQLLHLVRPGSAEPPSHMHASASSVVSRMRAISWHVRAAPAICRTRGVSASTSQVGRE
jgi:hypothetical protein